MTNKEAVYFSKSVKTPERGTWIYWRWNDNKGEMWFRSFVQDVDGSMIHLVENEFGSRYPQIIFIREIEWKTANIKP